MQQKKEVEMAINRKAPVMRTRVIRVDPFAQKPDRLLKDFFSPQEAYNLADKRNRGRTVPWTMWSTSTTTKATSCTVTRLAVSAPVHEAAPANGETRYRRYRVYLLQ